MRSPGEASEWVDGIVPRLDAVEARLSDLAGAPASGGLTSPDESTGEQWERGQVWAHIAEFVPYWLGELKRIVAADGGPVPFGRTKADPGRLAGIEKGRAASVDELLPGIRTAIDDTRRALRDTPLEGWARTGLHPVRGEVAAAAVVESVIVDHLEEHASQLESLRSA